MIGYTDTDQYLREPENQLEVDIARLALQHLPRYPVGYPVEIAEIVSVVDSPTRRNYIRAIYYVYRIHETLGALCCADKLDASTRMPKDSEKQLNLMDIWSYKTLTEFEG